MVTNLKDLFAHICGVARQEPKGMKDFFSDWEKLCKMYDFSIVQQAWEKTIKLSDRSQYPDPYFTLHSWVKALDFYHDKVKLESKMTRQREQPEEPAGISYPEIVKATSDLMDGKITRGQFAVSCERKGFDMSEYRDFLDRKGFDINGFASGLLGKTIIIQGGVE